MATTIADLLSVREITPTKYESNHYPQKAGNAADIAYGGNTLAVAITAALKTVSPAFHLYSALGNYLGPALTDRTLHCSVRSIRTTKTFATRHVEMSQMQGNGERKLCLFLSADFHIAEPVSLLTYSRPPKMKYSAVEDCPTVEENRQSMIDRGLASQKVAGMHKVFFGLIENYFDRRLCPEGVATQNFAGLAKPGTKTTQDHLPLSSKTTADYFRLKHKLAAPVEHVSALAFIMDMATSFLPLTHSGTSLAEAGAQSSLEFAFRIFVNDVDLDTWNLRELSTVTGSDGRTFTEAQVWDKEGRMVCNMTQQCILRPKVEKGAKI